MLDHNMDLHLAALDRQRLEGEVVRLCVENERLRAALEPILARLEMPKNGRSLTQDVMIQASELVELQAALAGKEQG